ncbi:hypothetical protein QFZ72_003474 [Bacillus sp. V2I10]|nr:hypothetical protein [Bacillus sp. V2I10]
MSEIFRLTKRVLLHKKTVKNAVIIVFYSMNASAFMRELKWLKLNNFNSRRVRYEQRY